MCLKVAVIGVGNIGYHHCRILSKMDDIELIAIADVDINRGQKVANAFDCKFYLNYDELLEKSPDAVTIAVPTSYHYQIAKFFLERGIPVLVEKPISANIQEIEDLIKLSRSQNIVLTVGHVERFNPALQKLKELIDKGELGQIINIVARRVGGYPPKINDTGVYLDLAVHDLDIFYYLTREIPLELNVQKLHVFSKQVEDSASIFVNYKNASGLILVNWITPVKIRQLSVTGTRGHAEVNYIQQSLSIYEHNVNPDDFLERDFIEFLSKYANPQKREIDILRDEPLKLELRTFIDTINGNTASAVDPSEVLKTMILMKKYDR